MSLHTFLLIYIKELVHVLLKEGFMWNSISNPFGTSLIIHIKPNPSQAFAMFFGVSSFVSQQNNKLNIFEIVI